jgi:hypothetical protein
MKHFWHTRVYKGSNIIIPERDLSAEERKLLKIKTEEEGQNFALEKLRQEATTLPRITPFTYAKNTPPH